MNFMDAVKNEAAKTLTENGAVGYSTTYDALVDFNFRIPSYRTRKYALQKDFEKILVEKDPYALKYLFYLRDCRNGLGERDAFRRCLISALRNIKMDPAILEHVIFMIPAYGRFDDLLCLFDTEFEEIALRIITEQVALDMQNMEKKEPASLLAKWLPSDNASSKQSRYYAHKIANYMHIDTRTYRNRVVSLRKYLDVTEVKTCANKWSDIDYNKVSSQANIRYREAFMRHDSERRQAYKDALAKGDPTVKIHSATNFPHDIVHQYTKDCNLSRANYDEIIEQLWKNLPDMLGLDDTLIIRDGSGSMCVCIGDSGVSAMDVADALTIYCADRCSDIYHNKFITFSASPKYVSLEKQESLLEKLVYMRKNYTDYSNTNIKATFNLILQAAVQANLPQEKLPKQVLIVSDMEFDYATQQWSSDYCGKADKALMETIAAEFEAAGYKMPKLVFWNVNSRTNAIPMTKNDAGVILVSGFSVNIIKQVLSGKTSSRDAILYALDSENYDEIPLLDEKNYKLN